MNKSYIMKYAWELFKIGNERHKINFSDCLRLSWKNYKECVIEKENIENIFYKYFFILTN